MARDPAQRCVVEPGALQATILEQKSARLDQVDGDPEAGGEPDERPGILGYVRLVEGEAQSNPR